MEPAAAAADDADVAVFYEFVREQVVLLLYFSTLCVAAFAGLNAVRRRDRVRAPPPPLPPQQQSAGAGAGGGAGAGAGGAGPPTPPTPPSSSRSPFEWPPPGAVVPAAVASADTASGTPTKRQLVTTSASSVVAWAASGSPRRRAYDAHQTPSLPTDANGYTYIVQVRRGRAAHRDRSVGDKYTQQRFRSC